MSKFNSKQLEKFSVIICIPQTTKNLVSTHHRFAKAKKSTEIYNACAQLFFCSLKLLFGDSPNAVVGVAWLSSL